MNERTRENEKEREREREREKERESERERKRKREYLVHIFGPVKYNLDSVLFSISASGSGKAWHVNYVWCKNLVLNIGTASVPLLTRALH